MTTNVVIPLNKVTRGEYEGEVVQLLRPNWRAGMMECLLVNKNWEKVLIPYDGYRDV